ncbi:MAG: fatty acid desaturase [Acidobacteria bacterium]|nr:fatty acid desaturase [Acidobacteriota bacterium]
MKYDSNIIKTVEVVKPGWQHLVKKYQSPDNWRSIWQIVNSFVPFFLLYYLMYRSLSISYGLVVLLALPTAGLMVRIFIVQHDCGHGSFFRPSRANEIVGTICGIITLTPYHQWRHEHAIHHATSGDLDRRGMGDVLTKTVSEYQAMSRWGRLGYRLYRHPVTLFLIGPQFIFVFRHRFVGPVSRQRERNSVYLTNVLILAVVLSVGFSIGFMNLLLIWLPVQLIAGFIGVWMFYVQHQYENTYWQRGGNWDYATAALMGSSYYKLPRILQWFSGNIGFHHIHHLSPKIPNYKLEKCHDETPEFQKSVVLTFRESLRCASLKLWDEEHQKMVGFSGLGNNQEIDLPLPQIYNQRR